MTDGQHPEYGHLVMVFFDADRRMQWREKASRCYAGDVHSREVVVRAHLMEECDQPDAAPGASAWMVHAGAPDAEGARKTALTVAKALGAQLNPVLSELGEQSHPGKAGQRGHESGPPHTP